MNLTRYTEPAPLVKWVTDKAVAAVKPFQPEKKLKSIPVREKESLPEGFSFIEEEQEDPSALPEGFSWADEDGKTDDEKREEAAGIYYSGPEKTGAELKNMSLDEKIAYRDAVNEEREYLKEQGLTKGIVSGVSFGFSENFEPLEPKEADIGVGAGKVVSSLLPISGLSKVFATPIVKFASKSPYFTRQLAGLARIMGSGLTGAANEALEEAAQGHTPSVDDLIEKGEEWAAIDAVLSAAGWTGRMVKALFTKAKTKGTTKFVELNEAIAKAKSEGANTPDKVTGKALEILEQEGEQQAAKSTIQNAEENLLETGVKADEVAQKSIEPEIITATDLKDRKISNQSVNKLTSESLELAEPYQPANISFKTEAENLEKNAIDSQLDRMGPRIGSEEELGTSIKKDVESQLNTEKSVYKPFYELAQKEAGAITHDAQLTYESAVKQLTELSEGATKPKGYESVIKHLENVLDDIGYKIKYNKKTGRIDSIAQHKIPNVSETIKLARRLNEIIDYEAIEPSVQDALKEVKKAAKQDIRNGLKQNSEAHAAFEMAEAEHARVASKYGKDSVRKLRTTEAGEKVSQMMNSPTTLGNMREILSPEQMTQVEREILERLNDMSYDKAKKQFRELEKHISQDNRKLAKEIVESKNPHNTEGKRKVIQGAALEDLSNAFTTGTRPEKALKLWKTPKGQRLILDALENSPNKSKVTKYLENQSFNDMVSSVLGKDGKLDLPKFNQFMKDPGTVNNIRMLGGEEAVTFFNHLDKQVNQLKENVKLLQKFPEQIDIKKGKEFLENYHPSGPEEIKRTMKSKKKRGMQILERMGRKDFTKQTWIKDKEMMLKELLGLNAQAGMTVFGVAKLGLGALGAYTFGIPSAAAMLVGYKIMTKLATSPRTRKAFIKAASKQTNAIPFLISWEQFGESVDEED